MTGQRHDQDGSSTETAVSPEWLALREPADAEARAADLAEALAMPAPGGWVVCDLGSGSGSMGRWLAPRLAGSQHWILCDRDPVLLARAAAAPGRSSDDAEVSVETRQCDITRLSARHLAEADLVTASALLDMFTAGELDRVVAACVQAQRPALITLSVTGRVELTPSEPFDRIVQEAFNDHQRRGVDRGRLLGPDAIDAAVVAFASAGYEVRTRPSPWRLGPAQAALIGEWLGGWVGAAVEQRPALATEAAAYGSRRRAQLASGALSAVVGHRDLLARPH